MRPENSEYQAGLTESSRESMAPDTIEGGEAVNRIDAITDSPLMKEQAIQLPEVIDIEAAKKADEEVVFEGIARARAIIFGENLESYTFDRFEERRKQILIFTILNANRMEDGRDDLLDLSQEIQELRQINEAAAIAGIKLKPASELMDNLIKEMGMDKVNPPASGVESIYPAFIGGMEGWREQQSRLRKYQDVIKGLESRGQI